MMNKPEWVLIMIGCFSCLCNGGIQPSFGLILSKITAVNSPILKFNLHIKIFNLL
jgi:hypothetical protein